jgi:hypothetical protein
MTHTELSKHKPRTIKTARDKASINSAAQAGFFPLVKRVVPSPEISSKFAVIQNRRTGEIEVSGDYRWIGDREGQEVVIDFTRYYPHSFPSPFAAYLIPPDLVVGERVFLEDLIEDVVGSSWIQGDTYRLKSCFAIWNGKDFRLEWDPKTDVDEFLG